MEVLPLRDGMFRLAASLLSDRAEAEDAVQDVLERLWLNRERFARCASPAAFAMTAVRNACTDRIRGRNIRSKTAATIRAGACLTEDADRAMDECDLGRLARSVIASLPEKQRLVIHLRDVEGYEMEEIAAMAEMEPPAVRMALSRARKTVRERLQKIMEHGNR